MRRRSFLLPKDQGFESDGFMEIFIQHQGQQTGPFTPQEIQIGLANGTYRLTDPVWTAGMAGWIPLSQAPHLLGGTPAPLAGAPPPIPASPSPA